MNKKLKGVTLIECLCSLAIFSLIFVSFLAIYNNMLFVKIKNEENTKLIYHLHGLMERTKHLKNEDINEERLEIIIDNNLYHFEIKKEKSGDLNKIIICGKIKNDNNGEKNINEKNFEFSIYK